jgi:glycosyltransferase involved in cell wall biosynthesis
MKFSLIVSTIGRDRELRFLLASLAAQTIKDFEVIVVDQSQGRQVAAAVAEFSNSLSIRHLTMSVRGASRGRNYGWTFAQGEILNFPDDDCTWPSDLLSQVAAHLDAHPALDALIARVDAMTGSDAKRGLVDRHNVFQVCVEFAVFTRRARMGDLRYDEQMGVGSGTLWGADEGPDLMLRMLTRGLTVEYAPELCMSHPDPMAIPPEKLFSRALSYSRGRGYLLRKHRYSWWTVGRSLAQSLGGLLRNLLRGRWTRARMHWLSFRGKCVGYCGVGRATNQIRQLQTASDHPSS